MVNPPQPEPDPALTASVYCAGRLDEVIYRGVSPFWRAARLHDPERRAYLWIVRYMRGGEHLKIRVHAPEELRPLLRSSLETAVSELLASLADVPIPPAEPRAGAAPPMDAEDEAPEGHPDRSLLWTQYRRSHIALGGKPFLDDDAYVARITECMGAGCEKTLAALQPDAQGVIPFRARQITLLKAAMSAAAAAGWSPEHRSAYFAYHRNWILRYAITQLRKGAEAAEEHLSRFDANLAKIGPTLNALQKTADATWTRAGAEEPKHADNDEWWLAAVRELARYLAPFAGRPGYQVDPFADDPAFPAVFKVLHGLANQLGLKISDEGFAYHILLRLSAGEARYGFTLEPPSASAAPLSER